MKNIITIATLAFTFMANTSFGNNNMDSKKDFFTYYKSFNSSVELKIENVKKKFVNYKLKNGEGQLVEKGKAPVNKKFQINIENLPSGIYELEIENSKSKFEVK